MSEPVDVQKLILPGLLGVWFALGGPSVQRDAQAAGAARPAAGQTIAGALLAQSSEPQASEQKPDAAEAGATAEAPAEPEAGIDGDVPFSELNEALTAARSRLTELTKAADIAKVAGQLREQLQAVEAENRQLKSALSQLQTDNEALRASGQTADRRVAELEQASEDAIAEARRLDEELVSMRWHNSQLTTNLTRAETAASESAGEVEKVRADVAARTEALTAAAEESAAEIARLQRELDSARERTLDAERRQAADDTELAELRRAAESAESDSARLARDLDATITELAQAQSELIATRERLDESEAALQAAEQEAGILRTQLAGDRSEAEGLKERLETAEADLETARELNVGLERQVELLKTAAGEATDAARQNLLAVENRIDEINAALASVKAEELLPPAGGPVEAQGGPERPQTRPQVRQSDEGSWVPRPSPPRADVPPQLIAAAAGSVAISPPAVARPEARPADLAGTNGVAEPAEATVDLAARDPNQASPAEAATLIEAVKAERDTRGLAMTVPGALLFAVDSDRIEPSAHEALANVAELVDIYDDREVLIIGHTDAVGDAGYNQQLSERRAALVKAFFVENFDIDAERLRIEGQGEGNPITSNATADGRNANRRVEVVILE